MDTSMQTDSPIPSRLGALWKAIKVLMGVLSLVGTSLGVYQWYRYIGSDPHVKFNIVDNQCFTRVAAIPNLESCFKFYGRPVEALWVSRVLIINDCQRNIIGTPYHDLMSSNISFKVSEGFKVLKVTVEKNDFDAILDYRQDGFSIAFNKWRPDQACLLNIYSEANAPVGNNEGPYFEETEETFTQGKLQISEYRPFSDPLPLIKHMPKWLSFILIWVGRIIYSLIIGVCFWGLLNIKWIKIAKRLMWNRKYLSTVEAMLANMTKDAKNSLSIDKMPNDFWRENKIPKPPQNSEYVKGDAINYAELKPILILCIVGFILSFIALSGLIYF